MTYLQVRQVERTVQRTMVDSFKVLSRHWPGESKERNGKPESGEPLSQPIFEMATYI